MTNHETPCTDPSPGLRDALLAYLYDECEPEERHQASELIILRLVEERGPRVRRLHPTLGPQPLRGELGRLLLGGHERQAVPGRSVLGGLPDLDRSRIPPTCPGSWRTTATSTVFATRTLRRAA